MNRRRLLQLGFLQTVGWGGKGGGGGGGSKSGEMGGKEGTWEVEGGVECGRHLGPIRKGGRREGGEEREGWSEGSVEDER